jgi:hypothetical protein
MAHGNNSTAVLCACAVIVFMLAGGALRADDTATREELRQLREENKVLQEQLRQQQSLIETLSHKVNQIEQMQRSRDLDRLESEVKDGSANTKPAGNFSFGKVSLSGEGGAGFFNTGSQGAFPKSEFRVDEARLFVEAPIVENVYFFGEVNLMTREALDLSVQLGEAYIDDIGVGESLFCERERQRALHNYECSGGELQIEGMARKAAQPGQRNHGARDWRN